VKFVNRWMKPAITPKAMKAAMKIMALRKVGMRSQFDSQEPAVVLRHPESGSVELLARGRTSALVTVKLERNTSDVLKSGPMSSKDVPFVCREELNVGEVKQRQEYIPKVRRYQRYF
jgi:hypothetical protein